MIIMLLFSFSFVLNVLVAYKRACTGVNVYAIRKAAVLKDIKLNKTMPKKTVFIYKFFLSIWVYKYMNKIERASFEMLKLLLAVL